MNVSEAPPSIIEAFGEVVDVMVSRSRSGSVSLASTSMAIVSPGPVSAESGFATGGSFGRYAATGHLTYVHAGTMFAVPFDLAALQPTGPPVPIVEEVKYDARNGAAQLDYSPQGHLIYLAGGVNSTELSVAWIESDGTLTPLFEDTGV